MSDVPGADHAVSAGRVPHLPSPIWFVVSFAVYVALGLVTRSTVLNWIVGPLWLLVTLYVLPLVGRRLLHRGDSG